MKKILLVVCVFTFLFSSAQSGVLNGTGYVPDITVNDVNGNIHNLYNYLGGGKIVVLEMLSTTCGTCLMYTSGTENSYQMYGPSGLDVAEFIGLEVNSTTTDNDILNFISNYNVSFPVCNDISPVDINYQLYYTPSYYVIYPDSSYTTICPMYCNNNSTYSNIESLLNIAIQAGLPQLYGCTDSLSTNYDPIATVDDGSCQYPTICGPTSGVYISDIIHDRATFNWDDMNSSACQVDQIRFRYRAVGNNSWSLKTMGVPVASGCNTTNTSKLVLNLTPATQYEYDFKIWYCNASTVNWHSGGTFTTEPLCNNVINLVPTPISNTKTEFCWDSVTEYSFVRLKYREDVQGSSFSSIGGFGVFFPTLCENKNGLTPGTDYRVMWRTWCSATGGPYRSPQWDGPVLWTQPNSIRIEDGISTISELSVYPNPTRDVFNVSFKSETKQFVELRVVNIIGEIIFSENLEDFKGEYTKSFNLSEYSKGVYFLELYSKLGVVNKRIMLQ